MTYPFGAYILRENIDVTPGSPAIRPSMRSRRLRHSYQTDDHRGPVIGGLDDSLCDREGKEIRLRPPRSMSSTGRHGFLHDDSGL